MIESRNLDCSEKFLRPLSRTSTLRIFGKSCEENALEVLTQENCLNGALGLPSMRNLAYLRLILGSTTPEKLVLMLKSPRIGCSALYSV